MSDHILPSSLPIETRLHIYTEHLVSPNPIPIFFDRVLRRSEECFPGEILNATFSSVLVPSQVESEGSGLAFNYDSTLLRSEHLDQGACVQLFYSENIFSFGCKQDLTDLGEQLESFRSAIGHKADFVRHITLPFPALEQPPNLAALEYFRLWTSLQRVTFRVDAPMIATLFKLRTERSISAVNHIHGCIPQVTINVDVGKYAHLLRRARPNLRDPIEEEKREESKQKLRSFIEEMESCGWNV
jgi:hypothetical protein